MSPKHLAAILLTLFFSISARADPCENAFELYKNGLWEESLKAAISADLKSSGSKEKCEFVLAASEKKAFNRIAKLELFIKKHPRSELLPVARYEIASAEWLLGDVGGALDKLARDTAGFDSFEAETILAFSLLAKAHKDQAVSWFKRARSDCKEQFISDMLDLYIVDCEFELVSSKECASQVVKLLRENSVDEKAAMGLAEKAHAFSANQTASLRFYIAANGFDQIAQAGFKMLGLDQYAGSSATRPRKRCIIIDLKAEEIGPVESALWVWLKERKIEARYGDDRGNIVIGPYDYEDAEALRMEIERFFDLKPKIAVCPKKGNNDGR